MSVTLTGVAGRDDAGAPYGVGRKLLGEKALPRCRTIVRAEVVSGADVDDNRLAQLFGDVEHVHDRVLELLLIGNRPAVVRGGLLFEIEKLHGDDVRLGRDADILVAALAAVARSGGRDVRAMSGAIAVADIAVHRRVGAE